MEIILMTVVLSLLVACLFLNMAHYSKLWDQNEKISVLLSRVCDVLVDNTEKIRYVTEDAEAYHRALDGIERSLLALKESQEAAKPIKSNNWDSVREAFKGPVRVEINERN